MQKIALKGKLTGIRVLATSKKIKIANTSTPTPIDAEFDSESIAVNLGSFGPPSQELRAFKVIFFPFFALFYDFFSKKS